MAVQDYRPGPDNDIRQMPSWQLVVQVAVLTIAAAVAAASAAAFLASAGAVGHVFTFIAAAAAIACVPGWIELSARLERRVQRRTSLLAAAVVVEIVAWAGWLVMFAALMALTMGPATALGEGMESLLKGLVGGLL